MTRIHFIGIGGVGMNGLAQLAILSGYYVSGSDRAYDPEAPVFKCLEKLGIRIYPQNGEGIDQHTKQVVFSTAIESDNADLAAAQKHGIPLLHRAEFLKQLTGDAELIAVAGTAGKTTTTGMLGWILECLGKNPSVYNGASVLNWKNSDSLGNVRKGSQNLWIIEADESDKSFLKFHPTHSIITNITKDHYELDELRNLFQQFQNQTSKTLVRGSAWPVQSTRPYTFQYNDLEFEVPIPGRHNLENASCAVRLCDELGFDLQLVREALAQFKGIERRMEIAGEIDGITIIDDYAHNPAKIYAALSAVSETCSRVHAYWRPHGFTPLFQNMDELIDIFSRHWNNNGGSIFILPVYYAGGSVERKATSNDLVKQLNLAGMPAKQVPDYASLKLELEKCARNGDAILGMGARDPELPQFAKRLVAEWKKY